MNMEIAFMLIYGRGGRWGAQTLSFTLIHLFPCLEMENKLRALHLLLPVLHAPRKGGAGGGAPTLASRSRSPGMMYGSGTRPVGFQLISGPRRLLTFHGMQREMEVINLEIRGAPPAESLCIPWGGMGGNPFA